MGRILVTVGLIVAGIGVLMIAGVPFGRLPGDIVIRRGHTTVYLPIVTSILVSIVVSLVLAVLRR